MEVFDSNNNLLAVGDMVHLIKDLKIKGMSKTVKRGEVFKIRDITMDEDASLEVKIGKSVIAIKQEFVVKKG